MKTKLISFFFFSTLFVFYSCNEDKFEMTRSLYDEGELAIVQQYLDLPEETLDYTLSFPEFYNRTPTTTNNESATLGRVIFYDKNLSKDKTISCASCHKQELAFSDNKAFSQGVDGMATARNSLALGAVFSFSEYYGSVSDNRIPFMWDNRFGSVPNQSEEAFANNREMGMEMHEVVDRIKEQPYYKPLFEKAFGFEGITQSNILTALDDFVNSMGTNQSIFDQELDNLYPGTGPLSRYIDDNFPGFSEMENLGKKLFLNNCSSCHGTIVGPASTIAENNGLELVYEDAGVGAVTNDPTDRDLFKVPTLRNIALTAPYMHDGRFATLEEVIDHYSNGIKNHHNLGHTLKTNNNQARQFNFTAEEKDALLAFFQTLTDESYINDEKFSNPFKE